MPELKDRLPKSTTRRAFLRILRGRLAAIKTQAVVIGGQLARRFLKESYMRLEFFEGIASLSVLISDELFDIVFVGEVLTVQPLELRLSDRGCKDIDSLRRRKEETFQATQAGR